MSITLDSGSSSLLATQTMSRPAEDLSTRLQHVASPQTPATDGPATFDDAARLDDESDAVSYPQAHASDKEAPGRDAAAGLIHLERSGFVDSGARAQLFNEQIAAHKDDAAWLGEYFAALGDDRVGDLMRLSITSTANPATPGGMLPGGSEAALGYYESTVDNLRTALDTLARDGRLTQADMTALYKDLDLDTSDRNLFGPTLVSDLFAKSSPQVQELFFNAAMAEGNDNSVAIASHVLARMPVEDQVRILGGMSQSELDGFVEKAMKGEFEAADMRKYFGEGDGHPNLAIGGISELLANANNVTVYYHAQIVVADYPPELQTALFDATASALTSDDLFDKFSGNAQFKDELGALALKEHDGFLDRALDADGGANGEDLGGTTRAEYSKILEMTLFTPPPSGSAESLMRHVDTRFQAIGDDLRTMDDAAFEDKYGRNRGAMAAAYGQMTGVFFEALDAGLTRVKDDADKAAEIMDPLFQLVDFGVGKGLDKAGPVGAVVSQALELTGASEAAKEAIQEKIKDGHIEDALQDLKDHGVDLSKLGEELYEHMSDTVLPNRTEPNGTYQGPNGDVSIKDAWQNGYDFVGGAPTTS